jgi:hypothetical protein
LAGRAVAALERIVFDKRTLHGAQYATAREALDGRDPLAFGVPRTAQASR